MTTDMRQRPTPKLFRLPPRSGVAGVNVSRARTTLADLGDAPVTPSEAAGRVLTRLRRIVAGELDELDAPTPTR